MAIETTTSVDVQTLTPFKRFIMTIGALPTSYLESMTYAELLMWFCNYLQNTVIPTVNNNAEAVEELQNLYEEIRAYLDDLNLQDEVNAKLDEMAESGELLTLFHDFLPIITPEMFGAKGDGETDDTLALQEAIDYAEENKVPLTLCNKEYIVSNLHVDDNIILDGNNGTIKSVNNSATYVLKVENDGISKSIIKNLKINGNNQNISGLYIYSQNWQDTYGTLENIEVFNCGQHGIYITGNSGNNSVRELKVLKCIEHDNLNGIYSNSMTDSYIINNTAYGNKQHGIYFYKTASIKISDSKCFMNGIETNDTLSLDRIPASAFTVTSDVTPITGKSYYTRTGNGNWQTPYTFTLFSGSSFSGGTDYYELTGNYQLHGHGIYLDQCDSIALSNVEQQGNAGDGINCNQCHNLTMNNIIGHINGYMWDNNYDVIKYDTVGLKPYYYGVYLNNCNFVYIEGNFFNENLGVLGYIQRSSVYTKGGSNISINATARVLTEPVEYVNITLSTFNCMINGNPISIPINLSNITLNEGYSIVNNDFNGSYLYVKNNVLYYNLVINKPDYFPTTLTTIGTFTLIKPLLLYKHLGLVGTNYADDFNGTMAFRINKSGQISVWNTTANAKFVSVCGSYIFTT